MRKRHVNAVYYTSHGVKGEETKKRPNTTRDIFESSYGAEASTEEKTRKNTATRVTNSPNATEVFEGVKNHSEPGAQELMDAMRDGQTEGGPKTRRET